MQNLKMRAVLSAKTPGSVSAEVITTAPHDGTMPSIASALEYLAKMRDGWVAAGVFPAGTSWETRLN